MNYLFQEEYDAVLIDFNSTIKKIVFLILLFFIKEFRRMQIIHLGQEDLHGQRIRIIETGLRFLARVKVQEYEWPNKDHITAEGDSVRMSYTVPSNMVAVGNGKLKSVVNKMINLHMNGLLAIQ